MTAQTAQTALRHAHAVEPPVTSPPQPTVLISPLLTVLEAATATTVAAAAATAEGTVPMPPAGAGRGGADTATKTSAVANAAVVTPWLRRLACKADRPHPHGSHRPGSKPQEANTPGAAAQRAKLLLAAASLRQAATDLMAGKTLPLTPDAQPVSSDSSIDSDSDSPGEGAGVGLTPNQMHTPPHGCHTANPPADVSNVLHSTV